MKEVLKVLFCVVVMVSCKADTDMTYRPSTMSDGSTRYSYDDGNQEICDDDNDSDETWCGC